VEIEKLRETIKEYAKDIRLNLSSVLTVEGAPGLTLAQIYGTALACSCYTKRDVLKDALTQDAKDHLTPEWIEAAKSAATIMAMNNIYYRFTHLVTDPEFKKLPARLRMSVIGKPGIEKADFELMCLAVSALEGCSACVNSHTEEVKKAGMSLEAIQSSVRIASVINATAQAISIG